DQLFTSGEEHDLLEQLISAGTNFESLVDDRVVPLVNRGNRTQAFRVLGDDGAPLIARISTLGGLLREAQDREVAQTQADVRSHNNQTLLILAVVLAGALGVGIVVAYFLPRRLSTNIETLVEAARGIERGDFDQPIDIESGDEIEELGHRFREMQSGLKRLQQLALQDRELEIAASVQRNLLQRTLPQTAEVRLRPLQRQANLVGGDWYDVDLEGQILTVVVGDSSGKGIAAALMATVALSALRAERGMGAGPTKVIERANRALLDATDADSFTTAIYVTLDLTNGEARWLNMGHPAPFLLRVAASPSDPAGGFFLEGPRNRALGWFDEPGQAPAITRLEPGDRLILYTDGFLEAKSPDGEVFGEHRFADSALRLAAQGTEDLPGELVRAVETFAAGKLDDDLTMLVIEFLGTSRKSVQTTPGDERWHSRK
nr:SpoIIE family protein phosphatase [Actinomycetota bacterium]